jgi:ParB family chromosome partitioning protein
LVTLTDSVRELGVLQPILVRPSGEGRYELIAGERRWRAARRAGLPTIPAVVREVDAQTSLEQAVVENLHRQDLNAMEEAAAYQRLADEFELTQDKIARRVGKSRSAVANTLRLFQLPAAVQRLIADGDLSAGHARALLAHPDRSAQERLAVVMVKGGLSVRQAEELVRKAVGDSIPAESSDVAGHRSEGGPIGETRPAALLELEDLLGAHLETNVHVSVGRSKGRMVIEFADIEDLKRIYQVMMRKID